MSSNQFKHWLRRLLPWVICALGALFYFYETILEVTPATIVPQLMGSFHLDGSLLGVLDMSYFLTYALMQIPGGMLLDGLGARRLMPLAALTCLIGLTLFSMAHSFGAAVFSRCVMGLGGSFGLMGAMYLVAKWLPRKHLAFFLGTTIMLGLSAGLLQAPLTQAIAHFGWRQAIFILGLVGAYFCVVMWLIIRDEITGIKANIPTVKKHKREPLLTRFTSSCKAVLTKRDNWPIAIYGGLMYLPTGTLGTLWGIQYLKAYYPTHHLFALANINAMLFLGWIVGSPLVGWVSDTLKCRRPILIAGSIGVLCCLLVMTYLTHLPAHIMFLNIFALGLFSSCSSVTFAMASEINTPSSTGTAIGFVNMLAAVPSIIGAPIFGYILDYFWQGKLINGARIYSFYAYQQAMILEYCSVIVAIVLACLFIRESYGTVPKTLPRKMIDTQVYQS